MLYQKILQIFLLAFLLCSVSVGSSFSQPVPVTTDSRIKTLVFNPNEVYELKFYYGYQSFIEFSENEEIEMISIGESFAWKITPAGKRLFVRALEVSAHTNMTIITNKRTYHFDIKSAEYTGREDEELVYTVRFYYPQLDQPLPIPPQLAIPVAPKVSGEVKRPIPEGLISQNLRDKNILALTGNPTGFELNFDYSIAGKADEILPQKVYDDGQETFFKFANDNLVIPEINAVDPFGNETRLQYIIRDEYVVVPGVVRQITLRLGGGLLCIYNNKMFK